MDMDVQKFNGDGNNQKDVTEEVKTNLHKFSADGKKHKDRFNEMLTEGPKLIDLTKPIDLTEDDDRSLCKLSGPKSEQTKTNKQKQTNKSNPQLPEGCDRPWHMC